MERALIREALRKHQGNRSLASRELGINPSTLYRKLKALPLEITPAEK
jgi:DNA-binding NtrC family response regulator